MNQARFALVAALALVAACDDKKEEAKPTVASAMPSAVPVPSMVASAAPAETASAAPSASAAAAGGAMITGEPNDRSVTVREPGKDKEVSVKVAPGGTLTLFLPDFPGTVWAPDKVDGSLGKPKEEVIPGFAPKTNGHQFKFSAVKGGKWKASFGNKPSADKTAKPTTFFTLTIDAT